MQIKSYLFDNQNIMQYLTLYLMQQTTQIESLNTYLYQFIRIKPRIAR